jgi:hypothetical protein
MPPNPLQALWTGKSGNSAVHGSVASSSSVPESPHYGLRKLTDGIDPTFECASFNIAAMGDC